MISFSIIDFPWALEVVGWDGTNTRVCFENVIIARLEKHMEKLWWFVCLFHCKELPLRYLVEHFDEKTSGPSRFCGETGKFERLWKSSSCNLSTHSWIIIIPPLDSDAVADLLKGQMYMYLNKISHAISSGQLPCKLIYPPLLKMRSFVIRWLRTPHRILRLFIATEQPSESLWHTVDHYRLMFWNSIVILSWWSMRSNASWISQICGKF